MGKRIRVVWILSLLSILLLIGVQGYWLYTQYRYERDRCFEKMVGEIETVHNKEFELRKKDVSADLTYVVKRTKEEAVSDSAFKSISRKNIGFYFSTLSEEEDSLPVSSGFSRNLNWRFDTNMREDSLYRAIDRVLIEGANPFRKENMDSLLAESFPQYPFTTACVPVADSLGAGNYWKETGTFFSPVLEYVYVYSPLEHVGFAIRMPVLLPPLLKGMGTQLLLSLGLSVLLTACFIFQVHTILKQRKMDELRQSFVHTMVHELKRPVQTLKMFISFLTDPEMRTDRVATEQILQDSRFELDNLSAYLKKLKDMVRADSEETPLRLVRFNWQQLVEKIVRLTRAESGKKVDIRLAFEMDSPWMTADPVHLANVLSNLIENALKYSGEQVSIRIETVSTEKEWRITVSDDGFGIPASEQCRVFGKFYRGTHLPDKNIPGMGLGLSYVKLIAEAHRGAVSLTSNPGKGTSVTFRLPR